MSDKPLREVAKLTVTGDVVWDELYHFSRLSKPGDVIIRDGHQYAVVGCALEGDTIHTTLVVQRLREKKHVG